MAIDSPQKRSSIGHTAQPWRSLRVIPTGTVTAAERQVFLEQYSGILWDPLVPVVGITPAVKLLLLYGDIDAPSAPFRRC